MTAAFAWPPGGEPISIDEFVEEDRTPPPDQAFSESVFILDHVEALREHVLALVAHRKGPQARDFVENVTKTLEGAFGGPMSPSIWMLRELRRNSRSYVDVHNVLLVGKLAEAASLALRLLEGGAVPRSVERDAYEVCLSVTRSSPKYRMLSVPPP